MVTNSRSVRSMLVYVVGFVLTVIMCFSWNAVAYAQSREDQYGSPTDPVDHANRAADVLSVLPDTGGPLILLLGVALVAVGAGMALIGRHGGRA